MDNEIETDNEIEILNDEWIKQFEDADRLYRDFYKEDLYYTNINYIYINKNNEIDKIKSENFLMSTPNCITHDEVLGILKRNSIDSICNKRYMLSSILKYNISLEPDEITNLLHSNSNQMNDYNKHFLNPIKNVDTIHFDKTIQMFHDLNDLFIIFYEKMPKNNTLHDATKKIYIKHSSKHKTRKII